MSMMVQPSMWAPFRREVPDDTAAERSNSFDNLAPLPEDYGGLGTSMDARTTPAAATSGFETDTGTRRESVATRQWWQLPCCDRRPYSTAAVGWDPSGDTAGGGGATQSALLFIKPHASGSRPFALMVRKALGEAGVEIASEGVIGAKAIADQGLVDAHYGALSKRAVKLDPRELTVPAAGQVAFLNRFGQSWARAVEDGRVVNAVGAAAALKLDAKGLEEAWRGAAREDVVKLGGG
jgi:hypothetical protein